MVYRNTHTGYVIETGCRISGGDWQPVEGSLGTGEARNGTVGKANVPGTGAAQGGSGAARRTKRPAASTRRKAGRNP